MAFQPPLNHLTKYQNNHDSHFSNYRDIDTKLISRHIELSLLSPSTNFMYSCLGKSYNSHLIVFQEILFKMFETH